MKPNFYKLFTFFFIAAGLIVSTGTGVQAQIISTIAGTGFGSGSPRGSHTGDHGQATAATLSGPFGVAVDTGGNVFIGEHYNYDVRMIDAKTGIITAISDTTSSYGFSGDGGPAIIAQETYTVGTAVDDSGNIYFCDLYNNRIRKITRTTGVVTTVAGNGTYGYAGDGLPATSANLSNPYGLAIDHKFNLYIADTYNNVIRKVDKATGIITTIAGNGYGAANNQKNGDYTGDGGPATSAAMYNVNGVALDDSATVMYIADSYNNAIRKVDMTTGIITTIAGTGFNRAVGTGGASPSGVTGGYTGDNGPATAAEINHPLQVAVDHFGDIYISDQLNNVIRKVDHVTGIITTFAGNGYGAGSNGGQGGYSGDGGIATSAELWIPQGITFDKCNNLYICDFFNNVVRKVTFNPVPITVNVPSGSICRGDSITLKAYGADSYTWTPSTGLSSTADSVVTAKPTSTTTYIVTGTTGCSTAMATSVITVNNAAVPINIFPPNPKVCAGLPVTLSVPAGATNVAWSPSTGLNTTSGDTVILTPTSGQVYTATSGGACPSSGTDTISILAANVLNFSPTHPQVCAGQETAILVTGGSNFNWSPLATLNKSIGDTVLASLPNLADSVVFTVIGTGLTGCPDTGFVILRSGGGAIGGTITFVRDTICQGTPGNLSLVGNSSNTLQWQSSTDKATFTNVGDTLLKYKTPPLQQTTWYRVTVGTGNCSAISDTQQLYVPPALTASFYNTQTSPNNLTFNSDSSSGNIRSYHWDFGDGGISTDPNPSHTYTKDSTYYVCLTLYDGSNCSYTFCRYSEVTDGVPTISAAGNWIIYPNPFSEQLTISSRQTNNRVESIEMYDVLGQLVINKNAGGTTNTSLQLDVSSLAKGMYYVMIRTADADYVQKVVKQ